LKENFRWTKQKVDIFIGTKIIFNPIKKNKKYMIIPVRTIFCIAVLFGTSHSKNIVKY